MKLEELTTYEILEHRKIADLNSDGYILRHKKTGAKVVLLSNDDDNKVFYVGFRTPPTDSTGVPHIIEHSVLCGSKNFPVKDPFIELAKGSLNTFLNAMTFPDKTLYPVASYNDKDFQNLMHVYLDAVFYPNIYREEKIFRQEGWHYEMEDSDAELTINGVVYSEMKGAFSSPDDVFERELMSSLFPDNAYSVESGGDPEVIPELTYEQFLDFHRNYYHPSNSYIYLYGDMDMAEKLSWIDENYLSAFDYRKVDSEIILQQPFSKPRRIVKEYPITEDEQEEDKTYLSYNNVVETSLNNELYLAFQILDYAICSAPGAPVKKALIAKGIGKDVFGSYDNGGYQPAFSIVAKNANASREQEFVEEVERILKQICEEGIDEKSLLAALNYYEFKYREADFGSYPKGLMYGLQIMDSWLYDENLPFCNVEALATFKLLRERVGTGYFEKLIQKYLLDNRHKSIVVVKPKKGLAAQRERELAERLAAYKENLSNDEIARLVDETQALRAYQEEPDTKENLEKIPLLKRSDLRKKVLKIDNTLQKVGDTALLRHDIFTNGIAYVKFAFDCSQVPADLFVYTGILKACLGYMDTKNYTYGELFNEINIKTGGIDAALVPYTNVNRSECVKMVYEVKAKVLYENIGEAFRLVEEMILQTQLSDTQRLYEIIAELKSQIESRMISAGHSVASVRAMSYFSKSAALFELNNGIPFYQLLEHLEANYDVEKDGLIEKLQTLLQSVFRAENLLVDYTSPLKDAPDVSNAIMHLKERLFTEKVAKEPLDVELSVKNEGFKTSAQIQYVCRAGNFRNKGYRHTGVLNVLRTILGYEYMWNQVRVKGGAYGCMTSFSRSGDTYFVSYRDPNLKKTVDVFENVVSYLKDFSADERQMTQFIIGTVSDVDTPLTPAGRGTRSYVMYMTDLTEEQLQKERDELLQTTQEDIRQMAAYMQAFLDDGCICVVGNQENIENAAGLFKELKPLFH